MSKNMRGTIFDNMEKRRDENDPIELGRVTIEGVKLDVAVFPKEVSLSGGVYKPVRLRYVSGTDAVLQPVKVSK